MKNEVVYNCSNENETIKVGSKLAKLAKKGDVFLLNGTLGIGKTTLSRAFIQKLCNAKEVPSPTFTLLQTYPGPDCEVFHYDLYRIKSAEEIFEIGMEEAIHEGICLIEWPEKMEHYLPKNSFEITIENDGNSGRNIKISSKDQEKIDRLQELEK